MGMYLLYITRQCLLPVLLLIPIITGQYIPQRKKEHMLNLSKQMESRETLEYGERCNSGDSIKLREITLKVVDWLRNPNEELTDDIIWKMQNILNTGRNFCIGKLLTCDETNNRCNCGPKRPESIYIRENGKCRWDEGSICANMEVFEGKADAACSSRTQCTIRENGLECSMDNLSSIYYRRGSLPKCYCSKLGVMQNVKGRIQKMQRSNAGNIPESFALFSFLIIFCFFI